MKGVGRERKGRGGPLILFHSSVFSRRGLSGMTKEDNTSKKRISPELATDSKKSKNSDKSKRSKTKSNGESISRDSKRSEIMKKKEKREEPSLGPPSDKEMKSLKRKSEMIEVKKENDDDKEDKDKKDEKEKSKESMVVDGIQTTENSPKSEEKTKDAQSGQELVPGESRQSVTGMKGTELRRISYTTIGIVFIEMVLCISAFIVTLTTDISPGPLVIIVMNLIIVFLSSASLLIILVARFHVSLFETEIQLKYAVTCARRFLLFSSHSIRFFLSLSNLTMSVILREPHWGLFSISIPILLLSLIHIIFSIRMQPVVPSPC